MRVLILFAILMSACSRSAPVSCLEGSDLWHSPACAQARIAKADRDKVKAARDKAAVLKWLRDRGVAFGGGATQ